MIGTQVAAAVVILSGLIIVALSLRPLPHQFGLLPPWASVIYGLCMATYGATLFIRERRKGKKF